MAKYGKTLAQVTVEINGKKQAEQVLKAMTTAAAEMRNNIRSAKNELEQLALAGGGPAYDTKKKEVLGMEKELKQLERSIRETKKFSEDVGSILDNMSKNSATTLTRTKRALESLLSSIVPSTKKAQKQIEFLQKAIKQVTDEIARRKGQLTEFDDIMGNLGKATPKQLDAVEKRLQSLLESVTKNSNAWRKYNKQMRLLQEERGKRMVKGAEDIMGGNYSKTIDGTKQAIDFLKKYQQTLKTSDTDGVNKVTEAIKRMNAELEEVAKKQSFDTLTANLQTAGTAEIKQAVDWLTKYQGTLEPLSQEWRKVNERIEAGNHRLKQLTDATKYEAMVKQFSELNHLSTNALNEQKKYWESMRDNAEAGTMAYDEAIAKLKEINTLETDRMKQQSRETLTTGLQTSGTAEIKQAVDWLTKYQGTLEPLSQEWREVNIQIEAGNERLKQLTNQTKLEVMTAQFAKLGDLSSNAFAEQKKYWEGIRDSVAESDPLYKQAIDNLKQITDLENTRIKSSARETLTTNLQTSGTADIKQAVDWLTKYQGTLEPLSQEWREVNAQIEAGNERLKQLSDRTKLESMVAQFGQLSKLSKNALEEQQKYWQSVLDNSSKGTAAYIQADRKLQAISQEMTDRLDAEKGKVLNNLSNYSVSEIEEAIKATEKLRDAQKAGSVEYGIYNNEIKRAKEYLQSYVDLNKQIDMEGKWANLTTLSAGALTEQKKYWQEMVNGAQIGSQELQEYQNRLKAVTDEENRRSENRLFNVVNNPDQYSTSEVEEAVKVFQKLRDEQKMGSQQWQWYADLVDKATEQLSRFKDEAKMKVMADQFANLRDLSVNALAEQKKYWQGVYDSAQAGTAAYDDAFDKLREIRELEESRTKRYAEMDINAALSGSWDKTIKETEEAIKLIEEYKKQLQVKTDSTAINEANEAIEILNRNLGKAKEALMDIQDAKRIAQEVSEGSFNGTAEDIEKAKKALEEYRKTLKLSGEASEVEKVDRMLNNLARSAELGGKNLKDLDAVLGDLKHASMDDLQTAAKQLQQELQGATRSTEDYVKTAEKLRRVNRELERTHQEWEGQESLFVRMTRRLSVYMAAYGSLSFIVDKVKELGQANLQLSDSIADVAKTTGLEADELAKLGKEIRAIDTRTAQEQLYELAAAAGQLGIKSETEIAGFVRAANMITVSLNELGTEATTQLMKIATLTGEAQEGTETALLSIGSAINELTASSAAAAGPIVDLMNRMGGIAAQSGITSAQMAAIGATADALGQSVEITGTSMNKFLATLMSSSDQIAYALNMDAKALRSFINEGRTMDAVVAVFEKMNQMGGLGALAPIMGELGSEGARMTQVLAAMAEKVDFLKVQLDISTKAYEEAISIQNEYNVKNENAIAILQRMGNAIKEVFVNNVVVDSITAILRAIYQFFSFLREQSVLAQHVVSALAAITIGLITMRLEWVKTVQKMTVMDWFLALLTGLKRLVTAVTGLGSAFKNLGKTISTFLKSNWLTLLISALTYLGTKLVQAATYVSEAAKATARYNRELQEETDKVDTLFNSLKRLNSTEADRAKTINTINQQYSQYLGFMLDEKDSAEKLAAAHQLINAELRKRMALNLRTTLEGTASNAYAEQLEKSSAGIGKAVENLRVKVNGTDQKERSVTTNEVMRLVSGIINKRVAEDTSISREALMEEIKWAMTKAYRRTEVSNTGKKYTVEVGADLYEDIEVQIGDLIDSRVKFQKKVMLAEDQANLEMEQLTEDAIEARKNANAQIAKEIEDAKRMSSKLEQDLKSAEAEAKKYEKSDESEAAKTARTNYEQAEKALKDHYTKMVDNANDYVESTRKLMEDYNADLTKDDKERMNEEIELYKSFANETAKLVPGIDPWGKGRDVKDWKEFKEIVTNLDTSSATALAAAYKAIKEDTALIPDNVEDFYKMYDTAIDKDLKLQTPENVAKQIHSWAEQIKNKLKTKFGRNTTLGFIFEEGSGGKRPKDEFEAALASLEAYYNDREEIVRKNALLEETTQEELDKRLQSLEQEHLSARIELRKLMLSKENSFLTTFSHAAESEYMQGIDYGKLQTQLGKLGKAMSQGLEKNLTADMVTLQKIAWEHQEEISKILIENDPVKKVALEYQQSFEKIDLFWAADELRTKEAANEKMATLLEFSAKRADLNDEDMRTQLEASKQFGNVVKTMTAEEYQAFLVLLDQYAEAATNAKRQATQKAIRGLEFNFDNSDMGKQINGQLQNLDEFEKQLNELNSSGIMLEASTLEKQREFAMQRIFLEQYKWEEMIKAEENGMNRQEVLRDLQNQKEKAQYESRVELVKLIAQQDENMFNESNNRIEQMVSWGVISDIEGTERQQELVRAQLALQQARIDEQIRMEEQGLARQEVIDNLRLARQNALYKADRRLTELTMQEYQQRAQVAQEWGSAIGTGLGEMIAGTEDAGKTLVKNLATMAVQSIGQMAQMYVAKQLLLSQQNMSEAASAMTTATTAAAEATAVGAAKTAEATAIAMATPDSVLTGGATGAAKAAVISGLIAAAVAASIAIINSLFPGAGSKATASNRKLSTGMLTYAEGNYPVLGNDGKVYDAKYEGAGMKTGIYGGGAHFGIFSEKQPEMIVDGKTTQKLILNYPYIYDAITTIAKNGRLVNAMPTFASGDYPAGMNRIAQVEAVDISGGSNEDMIQMRAAMEETREVNRQLLAILSSGRIVAHLDGLENHRQQKKNERFLNRRGIN